MRLGKLEPQWISPPGRYGLGFCFRCPVCVSTPHRIFIWFKDPVDGYPQLEASEEAFLHTRLDRVATGILGACIKLDEITLAEPIVLPCWEGALVDGELLEH